MLPPCSPVCLCCCCGRRHNCCCCSPAMFAPMSTLQSMLRYLEIIWLISCGPSERTRMPWWCTGEGMERGKVVGQGKLH